MTVFRGIHAVRRIWADEWHRARITSDDSLLEMLAGFAPMAIVLAVFTLPMLLQHTFLPRRR
jgi:hypothetical protein